MDAAAFCSGDGQIDTITQPRPFAGHFDLLDRCSSVDFSILHCL